MKPKVRTSWKTLANTDMSLDIGMISEMKRALEGCWRMAWSRNGPFTVESRVGAFRRNPDFQLSGTLIIRSCSRATLGPALV